MFRHAEAASQHSSIGTGLSLINIDCVVGADETRLWKRRTVWTTAHLIQRLQSVMNAAARSIAGLRRYEHITTTLADLHWLRASERIDFKLATLTYRCLYGSAPSYLSRDLRRVADILSRCRLRSLAPNALDVPPTRLSSVGDRMFAVAAFRLWNNLPATVTSASSLPVFRRLLKTHLFKLSYPDCLTT
jgi:hypothetical protein